VAAAATILGGPALYILGNALFKHAHTGVVPRSRALAVAALAALALLAAVADLLALTAAATVVVVVLAVVAARPTAAAER
jgi:low temperature requirement protein LtrA